MCIIDTLTTTSFEYQYQLIPTCDFPRALARDLAAIPRHFGHVWDILVPPVSFTAFGFLPCFRLFGQKCFVLALVERA